MADRRSESVQTHVRAQFDRQVAHYLHGSAMADQELLERIVRMARPAPWMRALDVACGAGFLA